MKIFPNCKEEVILYVLKRNKVSISLSGIIASPNNDMYISYTPVYTISFLKWNLLNLMVMSTETRTSCKVLIRHRYDFSNIVMIFPACHQRARKSMVRRRPRKKAANHRRVALNFVGWVFGAHRAERKRRYDRNKDQCAPDFFLPILLTLNAQILLFIGRDCFRLVLLAALNSFRFCVLSRCILAKLG